MAYVDGFVIAVPRTKMKSYVKMALEGKKIGERKRSTVVKMPTVCPTSRRYTPTDARNQANPIVIRTSGTNTRGRKSAVGDNLKPASTANNIQMITLTAAWKSAAPMTVHGRISSGNTTRLTKLACCSTSPGARLTHSANSP